MGIEAELVELRDNLAWFNGKILEMESWLRNQMNSVDYVDRVPNFVLAAVNEHINSFRQQIVNIQRAIETLEQVKDKEVSHAETE